MLGNAYLEKVYIAGKVFPILLISLLYPKESFTSNFKRARKNYFSTEQLPIECYVLLGKQKNSISISQQILSF